MEKKIDVKAFEAFVSKAFKLDAEGLSALYNEDGELKDFTALEEADSGRIKKLSEDKSNQYNRGLKEGASKLEKELRDKYDVDSDLIGAELFDHILTTKLEEVKPGDEDITKHPDYLKKVLEMEKLMKAKDKEKEEALTAKENEIRQTMVKQKVRELALAELNGLNPILPEDAQKAQRWKEKFIEEVLTAEFIEQETGIVPAKEGDALKDGHGYTVDFPTYVQSVASGLFEFKKAEDRSSSGNHGTDDKPLVIKDKDDYVARMREAKTREERIQLTESAKEKGIT